jgi:16S rRNA (adenine1518-N6/adenine1519-N6)-dimethyltransferase
VTRDDRPDRVRAKRSLSQNFLVDRNLRGRIVARLEAEPGDRVLEIGPGHGELSELLLGEVGELVLVEKDDRLAPLLVERWGARPDVRVVHADALELDLSELVAGEAPVRVISNLPYSITTPLLFRFLAMRPLPARIVVLVQLEVARRITAEPGTKAYGALTVGVRAVAEARFAFPVGRRAFRPVPDVDSGVVVIDPVPGPPPERDLEALRVLTRAAFGRRRKQIRRILRDAPEFSLAPEAAEEVLAAVGVDPGARPETIPTETLLDLARRLRPRADDEGPGGRPGPS